MVFFGRFIAILRALTAFRAGSNNMAWERFMLFNAAGGVLWAAMYGLGGYEFGEKITRVARPLGIALFAAAIAAGIGAVIYLRKHEQRLEDEAERALAESISRPRGAARGGDAHR